MSDRGKAEKVGTCSSSIKHEEGRLVLHMECRTCDRGRGSLNDGVCFNGVVGAIAEGMATDVILLSGRNETQYSGPTVEMVRMVSEMRRGLMRLSARRPEGQGKKGRACKECPADPDALFGDLSAELSKGVGPFYEALRWAAERVEGSSFDGPCTDCARSTMDDLHFLAVQYEDFVRFVLREGFSVVL
jgi:hypothetical protein